MPGIRQDQRATIRLIQDNLRDRYFLGFPIIKELVANADDARASCLEIGWAQGLPTAEHPLLKGPALVVVNDGPFRDADEQGLRTLGLGARESDESAIGRFGLGLKSVFHVCDAFFYLASSVEDRPSSGVAGDVLSPYFDLYHARWDRFSEEDRDRVRAHLEPLLHGPRWFLLWLPLRRSTQERPWLSQDLPGDDGGPPASLFPGDLGQRLALSLPLLKDLDTIRVWTLGGTSGPPVRHATVAIGPGSRRRGYIPGRHEFRGPEPLQGTVSIQSGDGMRNDDLSFVGLEVVLRRDDLWERMRASPFWPKRLAGPGEAADGGQQPEKGAPHGAVVIHRLPAGERPSLRIQWAVFLPVGEADGDVPINAEHRYEIYMHGYFFVDAGRRHVDFGGGPGCEPGNERELRTGWNRLLRDGGPLSLLIPTLDRLVERAGLREANEARELTRALSKHLMLSEDSARAAIGKERRWVYMAAGERGWRMRPAEHPMLDVPEPPVDRPQAHLECFPVLHELASGSVVTFEKWPRLDDGSRAAWPPSVLIRALDGVSRDALQDPSLLRYFSEFLSRSWRATTRDEESRGALRSASRLALGMFFRLKGDGPGSEVRDDLREMVSKIPAEWRVKVRVPAGEEGILLEALGSAIPETVWVPSVLEPEASPSTGTIAPTQAAAALRAAASRLAGEPRPGYEYSLADLLQACPESTSEALRSVGDLPVFPAEHGQGHRTLVSPDDIMRLFETGRLYSGTSGLFQELQRALDEENAPRGVEPGLARVLSKLIGRRIVACDAASCRDLLSAAPGLSRAEHRVPLLERMNDSSVSAAEKDAHAKAVRYLLHGDPRQAGNLGSILLTDRESDGEGLWTKLARKAMAIDSSDWRIVPPILAASLSPNDMASLRVERLGPRAVEALLQEVGAERIDCSDLDRGERERIVRELEDTTLLRKLRIHEEVGGGLVAIGERTVLDGPWATRLSEIGLRLTRLRRPEDPRVEGRLREIAGELDASRALGLMLEEREPSLFWDTILVVTFHVVLKGRCASGYATDSGASHYGA